MTIQILRHGDRPARPWKNGGGVTREVAAWPPGAGFDDFAWRVSLATVAADGPFSSFPGVDRVLTMVEGELALSVASGPEQVLSPRSPPLAFAGEAPVLARLPGGPATDFNVMTRRGRVGADVRRHHLAEPRAFAMERWTLALIRAPVTLALGGTIERLEPLDAVLCQSDGAPERLNWPAGARIILASLRDP